MRYLSLITTPTNVNNGACLNLFCELTLPRKNEPKFAKIRSNFFRVPVYSHQMLFTVV